MGGLTSIGSESAHSTLRSGYMRRCVRYDGSSRDMHRYEQPVTAWMSASHVMTPDLTVSPREPARAHETSGGGE